MTRRVTHQLDRGGPVRRMRWWDLDAVRALEEAAFPDDPWSAEQWWSELAGVPGTRCYLVAGEGAAVTAYGGLLVGPDAGQVLTLAVDAGQRGRGLGRVVLRALLAEAARRGCPEVLLEVRADNAPALGLYAAEGFERLSVRRGYYSAGRIDALVLRRRGLRG